MPEAEDGCIVSNMPERHVMDVPKTRTYGSWLKDKIEASNVVDDVVDLTNKMRKNATTSESKFSPSFFYDMINDKRYPSGEPKRPAAKIAVAIAEVLNEDPSRLDLEINESLLAAGHAPRTPAVVMFDPKGNPIVSRLDGTFAAPTSAENAAIYQILEQQNIMLRRLMSHLGLKQDP